jgi:hypothetical protein
MTAEELAVWLMAHDWTTVTYTDEIIADHPDRGRRRYTRVRAVSLLCPEGVEYWRVERVRVTR